MSSPNTLAFLPAGGTRNLAVGVVGLGYWGPNLLRVLIERTDVDVRWMCDSDLSRLESMARRYPGVRATRSVDDLLVDDDLDAVLIATPVFSHHALASRCLAAGKHTFVEKPLAASTDEALDLAAASRERGLVLMCGHTFLYSPSVRMVKQIIDAGELGEVYFISSSRVNLGLHQRDVSVVWDLAPHDFSILTYWLSDTPTAVQATGRDSIVRGTADVAFITLEYESGVVANVELSWLAPSKLRRTVVVGSKKMIVYEDGSAEPVKIFDRGVVYRDPETFGEWHLSYRTGDIRSPQLASTEPLAAQMDSFIRALRTGDEPEHGVMMALDVVRLVEAADASLKTGERVSLPDTFEVRPTGALI